MITHAQARRLVSALTSDPETIAKLIEYIDIQERGPKDWEHLADRQHSVRAANRAVEAISRCGTLTSDVRSHDAEIASLKAAQRDMSEVLEAILLMLESG